VLALMRTDSLTAEQAERRVFGASHAEVGGYLLGLWGLPDALVEAVAWHHDPLGCPGVAFTALTAVHAADAITRIEEGVVPNMEYLSQLKLEDRWETWVQLPKQREKKK
jgi:HD-like signal output (HDOD) protein